MKENVGHSTIHSQMTKSMSSPSLDTIPGRRRRAKKDDSFVPESNEKIVVMSKPIESEPHLNSVHIPLQTVLTIQERWSIQFKPSMIQPRYFLLSYS